MSTSSNPNARVTTQSFTCRDGIWKSSQGNTMPVLKIPSPNVQKEEIKEGSNIQRDIEEFEIKLLENNQKEKKLVF